MFRTRANNFMTQRRIFLFSVLLALNQYFCSFQQCYAENGVHINYVRALSGRNNDVKLLEIGGKGLKSIKNLRITNESDNCGVEKDLHQLQSSDHFILSSLKGKIQKNTWNYICYESADGVWKHLGILGKFFR